MPTGIHNNPNCQCGVCKQKRGEFVGLTVEERGHDSRTCQCCVCKNKREELKGKNSPNYGRASWNKGKKGVQIAWNKGTKGIIEKNSGSFQKDHIPWNKGLVGRTLEESGHRIEICQCYFCKAARGETKGKNCFHWQGGISFEPYSLEFNYELKLKIRQRDDFTCQFCGAVENGRAHTPHHVNYNKKDNRERNLILLCLSCNGKANFDRKKWRFLFETLMEIGNAAINF